MESVQASEVKRGNRKVRIGSVVSDCQQKTIIVEVTSRTPHPLYKKVVKKRKRFVAHDESNEAKVGDVVRIGETRPMSKNKRWRLLEIVRRTN
ncbi:MAG: 30S ribosomal protein S17 [Lentisphaerae bacterium GWF2_52_8]|nr:MAG: 30S ribosomal protein S17 [Lentisphaerae bacterium GWF2_52_8]